MSFIAVIGDIVDSRTIEDRAEFQSDLAAFFANISKGHRGIASPYTITLGDEFQALYETTDSLFGDMMQVVSQVYPRKLRIAIGVGPITTQINPHQAIGMDGPAFHAAREVMDRIKEDDRTVIQLRIQGEPQGIEEELANTGLTLLADLSRTWKANSWSILSALLQRKSIDSIARSLSITQRAVYKNMRTNGIQTVVDLCSGITRLIAAKADGTGLRR